MGLDGVEIIMRTEEAFGIEIPDEIAAQLLTPAALVDYVAANVALKATEECLSQQLFYRLWTCSALVDIFRKADTMSTMADSSKGRRSRRRFTDEFKQQAVRLVLDEGKSVTAVARELDLVASALGNWVKQAQADRSKGRTGLTTAEREELARLRKQVRVLEEEREILKKAAAFFAKHQR